MTAGPDTFDRLDRFTDAVRGQGRGDHPLDLAQSAALISAVLRRDVDVADIHRRLDALARACSARTFAELRDHVFGDLGFHADPHGASEADNSMIGCVLETRCGLPVLVATVTITIGRLVGIPVIGIGMPFQFLIGDGRHRDVYVDPVTGELWDRDTARARFDVIAGGRLAWDDRYLHPVRTSSIVERILRNLEVLFRQRHAAADLALVVSMLARLPAQAHRASEARRLSGIFN
jgi:regulator of sirC expression with transglutaminase-like and TPR domain